MAVKDLLDADLPRALFTGLRREDPRIDGVRVQQAGLREASDPEILAFAAADGRIVVTKDKATMRDFAGERIKKGERVEQGFRLGKRNPVHSADSLGLSVSPAQVR